MSSNLSWSDAKNMLIAYQNNPAALKVIPPTGTEILKGFRVDRADVQSILDNTSVQDVIILPAVKKADLTKIPAEQSFTMILAGTDSKGDIVESTAKDFLVPCPNSCPKNYPSV